VRRSRWPTGCLDLVCTGVVNGSIDHDNQRLRSWTRVAKKNLLIKGIIFEFDCRSGVVVASCPLLYRYVCQCEEKLYHSCLEIPGPLVFIPKKSLKGYSISQVNTVIELFAWEPVRSYLKVRIIRKIRRGLGLRKCMFDAHYLGGDWWAFLDPELLC
jgi:hypothetical protein